RGAGDGGAAEDLAAHLRRLRRIPPLRGGKGGGALFGFQDPRRPRAPPRTSTNPATSRRERRRCPFWFPRPASASPSAKISGVTSFFGGVRFIPWTPSPPSPSGASTF